jgi:hypothetical protein
MKKFGKIVILSLIIIGVLISIANFTLPLKAKWWPIPWPCLSDPVGEWAWSSGFGEWVCWHNRELNCC